MTAISAIISKDYIAIASDSLQTVFLKTQNEYKVEEYTKTKILKMEKFHAAASYWGFARYGNWNTIDFIKNELLKFQRNMSLNEVAENIKSDLEKELEKILPGDNIDKGIGIHLTGFERIDDIVLPELYLISNYKDTRYEELKKIYSGPQLYGPLPEEFHEDNLTRHGQRLKIKEFLDSGGFFTFNNGDPQLYNNIANPILDSIKVLKLRKYLGPITIDTYRALAKRPIEIIKRLQTDFCPKGKRLIGGKIHSLVITRNGEYL